MINRVRVSFLMTFIMFAFLGCDMTEVNNQGENLNEEINYTLTEPVVEVVDLSDFGLKNATDINDRGDIVGGFHYWEQSSQSLMELDFLARALNNKGQVVGGNKFWDSTSGSTTIKGLDYMGVVSSSVLVFDINDDGDVVGEVDTCTAYDHWGDIPDDYCEYDFFSMQWNTETRTTKEMEWFSTAISNNNKNDIASIAYMLPPHDIHVSIGNFGTYEEFGHGEPNSINDSGVVVGWITKKDDSQSNLIVNSENGEKLQSDLSLGSKLLRLTKSTGSYSVDHVVEMLRNGTFAREGNLDISNFKLGNVNQEGMRGNWSISEQDSILEAAKSASFSSKAFIWDVQGGLQSLGTLGGEWSTAFDINNKGQVVGYSDIGNGEYRAFYWDQKNGMIELPSDGKNSIARAINNHGQIVGYNDGPVMWEITVPELDTHLAKGRR